MKTKKMKQEGGDHLDVAVEEGPRSVRPKGGIGAARLLGLVSSLKLKLYFSGRKKERRR